MNINSVHRQTDEAVRSHSAGLTTGPLFWNEVNIVFKTNIFTPLMLLFQMGRAEAHEVPRLRCQRVRVGSICLNVNTTRRSLRIVRLGVSRVRGSGARLNLITLQVHHGFNQTSSTADHRRGRSRMRHKFLHLGDVVIDVVGLRPGELSGTIVYIHGKRGELPRETVRLGLGNETHRNIIQFHRTHTIRHTRGHVTRRCIVLADRIDWFQVPVGEINVPVFAVYAVLRLGAGVARFRHSRRVPAERLQLLHERTLPSNRERERERERKRDHRMSAISQSFFLFSAFDIIKSSKKNIFCDRKKKEKRKKIRGRKE